MICTFLLPDLAGRAASRPDGEADLAGQNNPAPQVDLPSYGPEPPTDSNEISVALNEAPEANLPGDIVILAWKAGG